MSFNESNISPLKNIIIINDFAIVNGGLAKVAIDSAIGLSEEGYQVHFFALVGPIDQKLINSNVQITYLDQNDILSERNLLLSLTRGIWNFRAAKTFKRFLIEFSPDNTIIHCHGFAKALSPSIWPVILKSGFPYVFTMHDYFLVCPNGGFYNFKKKQICTLKALGTSCLTTNCDMRNLGHKVWRIVRQLALKYISLVPRNIKNIIYISEIQKNAVSPYIHDATKLYYLENPISNNKPPRTSAELNDFFLFIGRFSPEKGAVVFAKAAKQAGVKAVFVGDGPDKDLILKTYPDAIVTEWVAPDMVYHWLSRAKCLVFPSLWYEASPLVTKEALAYGIPVICGQWTAASSSIENNLTGIVVTEPSPDAFHKAITEVENNIKRMSLEAYNQYWDAPPSLTRHISNLLKIYKHIRMSYLARTQ